MSNQTSDKSIEYDITDMHKHVEYTLSMWRHLSEAAYNNQLGLIRTYLWLAATMLAAHGAVFNAFAEIIVMCFAFKLYTCIALFTASILFAFAALLIGILSLSSFWIKGIAGIDPHIESHVESIERLLQWGAKSEEYINNLRGIIDYYEISMNAYRIIENTRAKLCRVQCVSLLIAAVLTLLSFVYLYYKAYL